MSEVIKEDGVFSVDIGDTPIEKVKAFLDTDTGEEAIESCRNILDFETELVLVECIQTYRMRYVVEVPIGKSDWALDTVSMEEAKEFSQLSLGETIVSHRIVTKDEVLKLSDMDNSYCSAWTDAEKLEAFVTPMEK
jgi:hypothetical protein